MLAAVVLAAVIVLPGFVLLYVLDQRGLLPDEGVDDAADRPAEDAPDQRTR
jgi:cytochrome d ubiquinol oxidase subunit II